VQRAQVLGLLHDVDVGRDRRPLRQLAAQLGIESALLEGELDVLADDVDGHFVLDALGDDQVRPVHRLVQVNASSSCA
jgi:hypothetical protein